jgi:hypothetical protein
MKNAECKRCQKKFHEKEIYTIQQFQYQKTPPYSWTVNFFKNLSIGEWDSFCENCILSLKKTSEDEFKRLH